MVLPFHAQEMLDYFGKSKKGKSRVEAIADVYDTSNWQKIYVKNMFSYLRGEKKIMLTGNRDDMGQVLYRAV